MITANAPIAPKSSAGRSSFMSCTIMRKLKAVPRKSAACSSCSQAVRDRELVAWQRQAATLVNYQFGSISNPSDVAGKNLVTRQHIFGLGAEYLCYNS